MLDWLQFEELSLYQKIKKLYFEGEFIVAIRYYKHKINLYLYNDFYVEVFYNPKTDCIEKIDILDMESSRIKFYADQIKLPEDLPSS